MVERELYDHRGDTGDADDMEKLELENLASDPNMQATVSALHAQLVDIVELSLGPPVIPSMLP